MFRTFFTYSDSFFQDMNYKLCSLKQQPNQYIYWRDKVLYTKSFLEHREPVQLPTSRRLKLTSTLRHVPYILLGESTMIVSNIWCQVGLQLWVLWLLLNLERWVWFRNGIFAVRTRVLKALDLGEKKKENQGSITVDQWYQDKCYCALGKDCDPGTESSLQIYGFFNLIASQ